MLIAVAPIVGTARVVSAASNLARALGFAIEAMAVEAELDSRRRLKLPGRRPCVPAAGDVALPGAAATATVVVAMDLNPTRADR